MSKKIYKTVAKGVEQVSTVDGTVLHYIARHESMEKPIGQFDSQQAAQSARDKVIGNKKQFAVTNCVYGYRKNDGTVSYYARFGDSTIGTFDTAEKAIAARDKKRAEHKQKVEANKKPVDYIKKYSARLNMSESDFLTLLHKAVYVDEQNNIIRKLLSPHLFTEVGYGNHKKEMGKVIPPSKPHGIIAISLGSFRRLKITKTALLKILNAIEITTDKPFKEHQAVIDISPEGQDERSKKQAAIKRTKEFFAKKQVGKAFFDKETPEFVDTHDVIAINNDDLFGADYSHNSADEVILSLSCYG